MHKLDAARPASERRMSSELSGGETSRVSRLLLLLLLLLLLGELAGGELKRGQSWWQPHYDQQQHHGGAEPQRHHSRHKSRRQAATDEAIRELRILESQDGQLRAFVDSTQQHQRVQQHQADPEAPVQSRWPLPSSPEPPPPPLQPARDFRCHLTLMTNEHWNKLRPPPQPLEREQIEPVNEMEEGDNFCLRFPQLAAQIPPFMLNLYRQLAFDIGAGAQHLNFSETVQMMPYRAEIMRSFRQPKLAGRVGRAAGGRLRNGDYDDELDALAASMTAIWRPGEQGAPGSGANDRGGGGGGGGGAAARPQDKASNRWTDQGQGAPGGRRRRQTATRHRGRRRLHQPQYQRWPEPQEPQEPDEQPAIGPDERTGNVVVELSISDGSDALKRQRAVDGRHHHEHQQAKAPLASPACDLRQRLLPADRRQEICFWFQLDHQLGQLVGPASGPPIELGGLAERLVEAELHVFKLFPQVSRRSAGQPEVQTRPAQVEQQFAQINRTLSAANLYHLRTNLLEVSLYQILPTKSASAASANSQAQAEFPLRLLDIRRIDLNSNGWETFYVKRAVEDWLREPRSNLGFVIKAKSMFDEPIQVGLIRFADAYDEPEPAAEGDGGGDGNSRARKRATSMEPLQASSNFSLSHQPLLVIYTTRNS